MVKHVGCGLDTACNGVDGPEDKVGKRPTNKLKVKYIENNNEKLFLT